MITKCLWKGAETVLRRIQRTLNFCGDNRRELYLLLEKDSSVNSFVKKKWTMEG
jgi:hypothetical protein